MIKYKICNPICFEQGKTAYNKRELPNLKGDLEAEFPNIRFTPLIWPVGLKTMGQKSGGEVSIVSATFPNFTAFYIWKVPYLYCRKSLIYNTKD